VCVREAVMYVCCVLRVQSPCVCVYMYACIFDFVDTCMACLCMRCVYAVCKVCLCSVCVLCAVCAYGV